MGLGAVYRSFADSRPSTTSAYAAMLKVAMGNRPPVLPRPVPVRDDMSTWIRVSELGYTCSRAESIRVKEQLAVRRQLDPLTAYTFALGTAHHDAFQREMLPMMFGNRLLGWWRRRDSVNADELRGGYRSVSDPGLVPSPGDGWEYVEPHLVDADLMLHGHPDAVVDWTGLGIPGTPDGLEVQELKTCAPEIWRVVDPWQGGQPMGKHVLQAHGYMILSGIRHARITYIRKGDSDPSQGKGLAEWRVPYDGCIALQIKDWLIEYQNAMRRVHLDGVVHGERATDCTKKDCGRAIKCPVKYECWNMKSRKVREAYKLGEE